MTHIVGFVAIEAKLKNGYKSISVALSISYYLRNMIFYGLKSCNDKPTKIRKTNAIIFNVNCDQIQFNIRQQT